MTAAIRPIEARDIDALKAVIDSSNLFPSAMLDDMIAGYLGGTTPDEMWLTVDVMDTPVAIAYCASERMTEGTSNLLLIAVHEDHKGQGIGSNLIADIEDRLRKAGQRILLVETSGVPAFERARAFYHTCGYTREAVIRDYYAEGDDKVVFWKRLS